MSLEFTIEIYLPPCAAAKSATLCAVRGAGACFLPVRAENAAGTRWEIVRGFRVRRACSLPEAANTAREGFGLFAAGGGGEEEILPAGLDLSCIRPLRAAVPVFRDRRPELYRL